MDKAKLIIALGRARSQLAQNVEAMDIAEQVLRRAEAILARHGYTEEANLSSRTAANLNLLACRNRDTQQELVLRLDMVAPAHPLPAGEIAGTSIPGGTR